MPNSRRAAIAWRICCARAVSRLDHYAIFMENNARYIECCAAGERAGLYYTCVNSYLTPDEIAYIVNNSESKVLITSQAKREVAMAAMKQCPKIELCLIVDGEGDGAAMQNLDEATAGFPATPIADETFGVAMLYSSGTTGRPKGMLRPLPEQPPSQPLPLYEFLDKLWRYRDGMIYLSPAPLYHSAPQAAVNLTIDRAARPSSWRRFDPERYLQLVEIPGDAQPTGADDVLAHAQAARDVRRRYDLSSLECAIHAAAPCPVPVKEQMIEWWGPIILEYYGMTEAMGFTACDSAEWLAHQGTVGKVVFGELHILDEKWACPTGTPGTLWFKSASRSNISTMRTRRRRRIRPTGPSARSAMSAMSTTMAISI